MLLEEYGGFKIGNKVKVIEDNLSSMSRVGDIGEIYRIEEESGWTPRIHIDFGEQFFRYGSYFTWQLKKVK